MKNHNAPHHPDPQIWEWLGSSEIATCLVTICGILFSCRIYSHVRAHVASSRYAKHGRAISTMLVGILLLSVAAAARGTAEAVEAVKHVARRLQIEREYASAFETRRMAAARSGELVARRVTAMHFNQLCTFNGYLAGTDWIESDTHPCITRGDRRVWRIMDRSLVGTNPSYLIGKVGGDGSVDADLRYDPQGNPSVSFADGDLDGFERAVHELAAAFPEML